MLKDPLSGFFRRAKMKMAAVNAKRSRQPSRVVNVYTLAAFKHGISSRVKHIGIRPVEYETSKTKKM